MKLFALRHLGFVALLVWTLLALARADEYDDIRLRWTTSINGGAALNPADPDVAAKLASLSSTAQSYWNSMDKSTNRTALWSDYNQLGTLSSHITATYERLRTLANAYVTPGTWVTGNASLRTDLIDALDWMNANIYNSTKPEYYNWWDWEIGAPLALNDTTALLYAELTPSRRTSYMAAVDHFTPVPRLGGANRVWTATVVAVRGAIVKDSAKLAAARDSLGSVFTYVNSGDGYYTDGSMVQHATHPYTGGYGNAFLSNIAPLIQMLSSSQWQITDPNLANLYQWVHDSYEPVIYKGSMPSMLRGREISRPGTSDSVAGASAIDSIIRIAQFAPPDDALAFKRMVKYWLQTDPLQSFPNGTSLAAVPMAKAILNDSTISSRGELIGHYNFPKMDRVMHLRPGFGVGLSLSSSRIATYESINQENLRGWYCSEGMTYLHNNDASQYTDEFWNTVNAYRLPGTTVDTVTRANGSGQSYLSGRTWVGGANLGLYGVAGMQLAAWSNGLTGKKSWFMFDDEIVCLGADIQSTSGRTIETTVENRRLAGSGNQMLTVNGASQSTALGWSATLPAVSWAHLAGNTSGADIGYVFPQSSTIKGLREARSGSWYDINNRMGSTNASTRNYLTLWFDHGVNPSGGTYSYALLPGKSSAAIAAYAAQPQFTILENTANAQTVRENGLGVTAANFWNDASHTSGAITSDRKASVILQDDGNEISLAVSDPTQVKSTTIILEVATSLQQTLAVDPRITVIQLSPSLRISVNVSGANGQSIKARFSRQAPPIPNTLYWDGTDTTANADGGNGTWNATNTPLNWDMANGTSAAWPTFSTAADHAIFSGVSGIVTLGDVYTNRITFNAADYTLNDGRIFLDGSNPTISNAVPAFINSELAGSAGFTKTGAGTLTLGGSNSNAGTTTLNAGMLALSGGNNRLATTGSLTFSGPSTLNLGGNSQELGNIAMPAGGNMANVLTNGILDLTGNVAMAVSPSGIGTSNFDLDASGLTRLTISKPTKIVSVGGNGSATASQSSTFKLSATNNIITVSALNVGTAAGTGSVVNSGNLALGSNNVINAANVTIGSTRSNANLSFQQGLIGPSATFRGLGSSPNDRIIRFLVGVNGAGATPGNTQTVDFSIGSMDARVTDLIIGQGQSTATTGAPPSVTGLFTMGLGNLDVTNLIISDNTNGGGNSTNTGTFNQNAGTVKVGKLVLGQRISTVPSPRLLPSYNLGTNMTSGILKAAMIQSGTGAVAITSLRYLNFNNGTIQNYDEATDLSIDGSTPAVENRINVVIASSGLHQFSVDAGRSITLGANTVISGSGVSLTKSGPGALVLAGLNNISGVADVQNGTFQLASPWTGDLLLNLGNGNSSGRLVLGGSNRVSQAITGVSTLGTGANNAIVGGSATASTLAINLAGENNTYSGRIGGPGTYEDSLSLTKSGAGTLTLTGNNTFSAGTTIAATPGAANVLRITNSSALGTGSLTIGGGGNTDGARLELSGGIIVANSINNITVRTESTYPHIRNISGVNTLTRNLTTTSGGAYFNLESLSGTLVLAGDVNTRRLSLSGDGDGAIVGSTIIAATHGIEKSGNGTWTIHSGDLNDSTATVSSGRLTVNGPLLESNLAVVGGTLAGNGSVANIALSPGGTIAPGNVIGTLTATGNVSGTGILAMEIDGSAADKLVVAGTLDISNLTLRITSTNPLTLPVYGIVDSAQPINGTGFSEVTIPSGYMLTYNYNDGIDMHNIALVMAPFTSWITGHGLAGGDAAPTADPDHDGLDNLIEFVIGTEPNPANPNANSSALDPTVSSDTNNLIFTFRRTDLSLTQSGIEIAAEYGSNLADWTTAADGVNGVAIEVINNIETDVDQVQVSIPKTLATGAEMFARLTVLIP